MTVDKRENISLITMIFLIAVGLLAGLMIGYGIEGLNIAELKEVHDEQLSIVRAQEWSNGYVCGQETRSKNCSEFMYRDFTKALSELDPLDKEFVEITIRRICSGELEYEKGAKSIKLILEKK